MEHVPREDNFIAEATIQIYLFLFLLSVLSFIQNCFYFNFSLLFSWKKGPSYQSSVLLSVPHDFNYFSLFPFSIDWYIAFEYILQKLDAFVNIFVLIVTGVIKQSIRKKITYTRSA